MQTALKHTPSPIIPNKGRKKVIAFGWYGGKYSHLDWLLPQLPTCHHYCEPFGGSGAVLLNRVPSPVETYNDLDGEVVNFFRVLRECPDELIRQIALTPFSRSERGKSGLDWHKQLPSVDGPTAKTHPGLACQASSADGWAVLSNWKTFPIVC